jgi:hypothetical protein
MKFMKKTKLLLPCAICAVAMLIFASCKKGDTGPAGPAGPGGPAGAAGAAGPAGAAGTANVIYSNWIDTLVFKPDTATNMTTHKLDTLGYFTDINVPKLTLDILNKGEIKVYVNAGTVADPTVLPVPYNNGLVFIDPSFFLSTIELYSNARLTNVPFRYILIPGGTTARTYKSINWNNYNEVKAYLGLKD